MQMIDLSGVKDFNAARFLIYWLVATVIGIQYRPSEKAGLVQTAQ